MRSRRCAVPSNSATRDCYDTHAHCRRDCLTFVQRADLKPAASIGSGSLHRKAIGIIFTRMRSSFARKRKNATTKVHKVFAAEMSSIVLGAATVRMQNDRRHSLFSSSLLPRQTLQQQDTDGKCACAVGALSCSPFRPPAVSCSSAP